MIVLLVILVVGAVASAVLLAVIVELSFRVGSRVLLFSIGITLILRGVVVGRPILVIIRGVRAFPLSKGVVHERIKEKFRFCVRQSVCGLPKS